METHGTFSERSFASAILVCILVCSGCHLFAQSQPPAAQVLTSTRNLPGALAGAADTSASPGVQGVSLPSDPIPNGRTPGFAGEAVEV